MYKYTICFIRKGNEILLLNRNKKPNMGMWNGVGGKIEENETPYKGIIRETLEETGIELPSVTYKEMLFLKIKMSLGIVRECMCSLLIYQMECIWTRH